MSLKTFSAFTYGHNITASNRDLDFSENGIDILLAQVSIGSFTLQDFGDKVSIALNSAGALDYTVTLDRTTRKFTVSASGSFDLLVTGPRNATSVFALLGFTSDKTGLSSYEADVASGLVYFPQFKLQRFVDFDDNIETADSSVNTSASGVVEVVSFGEIKTMECNITYATDIIGQGAILNNPTGVSDLRDFMNYCIKKRPIEFIYDVDNFNIYRDCILDSTPGNQKGTGFKLNELYARGLANYYETGLLTFREV